MPNFDNILFEPGLPAARITLNRPAKRNALNAAMIHEITESLAQCATDEKVRVVVLGGAGADFCSGADLQALESNRDASVLQMMEDAGATAELFLRMRQHPKPIIAAVQGRALAGGCGLAMAADLVLAAQSAQFGYPEINVGFIPAMVTALLRRAVSEKNVFELVTTGEIIPATRAREIGLINRVFPDQDFQREVDTYAAALSAKPAATLTLAKKLVYHMDGMSFATAVEAGLYLNVLARKTDDFEQGVKRFLSKSPGQGR
jgi:methylglutaconyl-CoA hydratase